VSRHTDRDVIAKLDALYATLPTIRCRKLCGESCGPVLLTTGEAERVRRFGHAKLRTDATTATCSALSPRGTCRVYPARPLICRVWGLVKRMSCPFGCVPDRWLTDVEFAKLAAASEAIAGSLLLTTPTGPQQCGESFRTLLPILDDVDAVTMANHERLAEHTRALRAIHHGQCIGLADLGQPGTWLNIDAPKPRRDDDER
jgi:uncharacterized protein